MIPMGYENHAVHLIPELSEFYRDIEDAGRYSPYEDFNDARFGLAYLKFMPDFFVFKGQTGESPVPFAGFVEVKSTVVGKVVMSYEAVKTLKQC